MMKLMKFNKKSLIENIIVLAILNVFFITCFITKESNILLIFNVLIVLLLLYKCKFSFFSIKTIILNYVLSPIFFQNTFGRSYGMLQITQIPIHFAQVNTILIIYNVLTYLILSNTNILEKEKELFKLKPETKKIFANICSIIAIVFSIIALPYLPFKSFEEANRQQALLPGNAWNHLAIVALIFAYPQIKNNHLVKFSFAFCIFWFLSHFERVDMLGLIVLIAVLFFSNMKQKMTKKVIIKYAVIAFALLALLLVIGEVRVTDNGKPNYIEKIFVQNTAADLGYIYNASVEYAQNNELLKGKTYLAYLVEAIPLLPSNERIEYILEDLFATPGGSYLLSEPLMNFGVIGIIVFQILEFIIISIILNMKSDYKFYIYCFILATVFRICWYGLIYIEIGLLYFIPIMYLMKYIINKVEFKKLRGNYSE